jgi:transcriptional regulator with XRE-family HTH domain
VSVANLRERICQEVARLLRETREKRRISKNALAQLSGISRRMIGFVERGERNPTLDTLLRLTDAMGVDLEALIKKARKASRGTVKLP